MPITRKLYTLGDIKAIIMQHEKVGADSVIECGPLTIGLEDGYEHVSNDHFIIQVDHDE